LDERSQSSAHRIWPGAPLANRCARNHSGAVKDKQPVASPPARQWTRPEDYVEAMARKRSARHAREPKPRTEPEAPRAMLSTIPFLALLGALAVLSVAIMVAAWPGGEQQQLRPRAPVHEVGTAEKGWFQEAQKEMHQR
jgi:hypothetical protein